MKYNPFSYIHSEKDILKFVQIIIANTKGEGEKTGEAKGFEKNRDTGKRV